MTLDEMRCMTIATERAAVKAHAADYRDQVKRLIERGRLTADEGTLITKQIEIFAESIVVGLHVHAIDSAKVRVAVKAALVKAGLDERTSRHG